MSPNASTLRKEANELIKDGKYMEAILKITHAIKLNTEANLPPTNSVGLYTNRSLAFRHIGQFYLARKDAKEAIEIDPEWYRGYQRLGEVEMAAEAYQMAVKSFKKSLRLDANNAVVKEQLLKAEMGISKKRQSEIWNLIKLIAIGLLLGGMLATLRLSQTQPFSWEFEWVAPLIWSGILLAPTLLVFLLHKMQSWASGSPLRSMMDAPIDLLGDEFANSLFGGTQTGGGGGDGAIKTPQTS